MIPDFCNKCGGESNVIEKKYSGSEKTYRVECSICFTTTAEFGSVEEAVTVWNSKWSPDS